jgi:hypothetical protein
LYGTLHDSADQMNVRSWQANIARDRGDLTTARRVTRDVIAAARREQAVPWTVDLFQALADIELIAGDYPAAWRCTRETSTRRSGSSAAISAR